MNQRFWILERGDGGQTLLRSAAEGDGFRFEQRSQDANNWKDATEDFERISAEDPRLTEVTERVATVLIDLWGAAAPGGWVRWDGKGA